ncbi:MAG: hypothetical protein H6721_07745 [Sandaracinus sp.]|nr:hypothetical protein [Myxococcales bacterium]MCB9598841.1 hypothetical protein [Sandaracinus sp.]MCB9613694.1 hypothetical protein [Sandaracinus sp.]MCB9632012.1 hypothetical protein [Sandaracinus sp.]
MTHTLSLPSPVAPSELVPWVTRVLARLGHAFTPGPVAAVHSSSDVGGWYVQHERSEWSDAHVMLWMEREDRDNGATSSHAFSLERRVKGELLLEGLVVSFEGFEDVATVHLATDDASLRDAWVAALREG